MCPIFLELQQRTTYTVLCNAKNVVHIRNVRWMLDRHMILSFHAGPIVGPHPSSFVRFGVDVLVSVIAATPSLASSYFCPDLLEQNSLFPIGGRPYLPSRPEAGILWARFMPRCIRPFQGNKSLRRRLEGHRPLRSPLGDSKSWSSLKPL